MKNDRVDVWEDSPVTAYANKIWTEGRKTQEKKNKSFFDWLPTWLVVILLLSFVGFMAAGCSTKNNYYNVTADNSAQVYTFDGGDADQGRDVTTDAVNPRVDRNVLDGGALGGVLP